jgi:predicted metal-dependent phosphoesterase TrpH
MSRCDLHIHSRFSARSEEWLFRRFDLPDSYTDPRELHRLLRRAGWILLRSPTTNTIEGNLEIADLDHTFISEEVTTHFPQDPCKIHLLVWGISEAQHAEITTLRDNIYELAELPPEKLGSSTRSRIRFTISMASSKRLTSND